MGPPDNNNNMMMTDDNNNNNVTPELYSNAITEIYQNNNIKFSPIVQILDIRLIGGGEGKERYRLVISDGIYYIQAMLATQLNAKVKPGELEKYALVQLNDFIINEVSGRKIVIILKVDCVSPPTEVPIGSATDIVKAGKTSSVANNGNNNNNNHHHQQQQQQSASSSLNTFNNTNVMKNEQTTSFTSSFNNNNNNNTTTTNNMKSSYQSSSSSSSNHNNNGAIVQSNNASNVNVMPIQSLNPYQNKWTIRARVTSKGEKRSWSNARSEGTLFSVDLLDEFGGEIRGTFFKETCEKFYPILEEGKVYLISGGRLKVANKQYTTLKNDYEVTFDNYTKFDLDVDDNRVKRQNYDFIKINQIETIEAKTSVDLVAMVKTTGEASSLTLKNGKETMKRDIFIVDDSGVEIKLTLWGNEKCQMPEWDTHPIVALKGVQVSDYNGRTLNSSSSGSIAFNPNYLQEAEQLYNWWNSVGSTLQTNSISQAGGAGGGTQTASFEQRHTIASIKDDRLGFGEKPDYITLKGTLTFLKHDNPPWYESCPEGDCKKKVISQLDGFHCTKCNRDYDRCINRYILNLCATDHTGNGWFTAFNDQSISLLKGKTADEMCEMKDADEASYENVYQESNFETYIFKVRVKSETVNDETRVKNTIMSVTPINYVQESNELIKAIEAYQ